MIGESGGSSCARFAFGDITWVFLNFGLGFPLFHVSPSSFSSQPGEVARRGPSRSVLFTFCLTTFSSPFPFVVRSCAAW